MPDSPPPLTADEISEFDRLFAEEPRNEEFAAVQYVTSRLLATIDAERARAEALERALREVAGMVEHVNTRRGSRNGRIKEVVAAALAVEPEADRG